LKNIKVNKEIGKLDSKIFLINKNKKGFFFLKDILENLEEDKDLIQKGINKDNIPVCIIDNVSKFIFDKQKKNKKKKNIKTKKIIIKLTCNDETLFIYIKKIKSFLNKKNIVYVSFLLRKYMFKFKDDKKDGIKKGILLRVLEIISKIKISLLDNIKFFGCDDLILSFLKNDQLINYLRDKKINECENDILFNKLSKINDFSFNILKK
jgi:translation initiation factor IF-3